MRRQSERIVAEQVAKYLQTVYPDVVYRFDLAADLKLTMGQAARHKRLHPQRGYPDLWIAQPAGMSHGLFIELKADGVKVFKKDGTCASEHIDEQNEMLVRLLSKGFSVAFASGFDEAKQIIDEYMGAA